MPDPKPSGKPSGPGGPSAKGPVRPAAPGAPPARPTGAPRPAGAARPAGTGRVAVPAAPVPVGKGRVWLMRGILTAIPLLVVLIAVRVILIRKGGERTEVDVSEQWKAAYESAQGAEHDISDLERKVWADGKTLEPGDLVAIREKAKILVQDSAKLHDLLEMIREKVHGEAKETGEIAPKLLRVKLWLLDADDVVDEKKPMPRGFVIPFKLLAEQAHKAEQEMREIAQSKGDTLPKMNEEAKQTVRAKLSGIRETLSGCAEKLSGLEDYLKEGLARESLAPDDLPEVEELRGEMTQANMANKTARELQADFR